VTMCRLRRSLHISDEFGTQKAARNYFRIAAVFIMTRLDFFSVCCFHSRAPPSKNTESDIFYSRITPQNSVAQQLTTTCQRLFSLAFIFCRISPSEQLTRSLEANQQDHADTRDSRVVPSIKSTVCH
jgi:hypothetical protein